MTTLDMAAPPGIGPHGDAIGSQRGAGPHPLTIPEPDPAILASSHETEAGAWLTTELEMPDNPSIQHEHGEQTVALDGLDGIPIDGQA
jgi:hypothetical protein